MKGLKKLALVSAIAALPAGAMAMEALDDATMSAVTGQDGISMSITVDMDVDVGYEDTTGLTNVPGGFGENAGMLYMPGLTVNGVIGVDIDVGADAAGVAGGVLQIGVSLPSLTIASFELYVSGSGLDNPTDNADFATEQRNATDGFDAVAAAVAPGDAVLEAGSVTLNDLDLSIQLGSEATNLVEIVSATTFSIDIADVVVRDTANGGELTIAQLQVSDVDLQGTTIGVVNDSLVIGMPTGGSRIAMMGVGLRETATPANANVIGNVFLDITNNAGTAISIQGR